MATFTMCSNTLCPNAGSCRRVQATASKWQSFMMFEYTVNENGVICENYMPVSKTVYSANTENDLHHLRETNEGE